MLGKANEIKTCFIEESKFPKIPFEEQINDSLINLQDRQLISIQVTSAADADGVIWNNALIIYKEV